MRTVFFTGAGLSAESGIPTFRGPGGLYEGMNAEEWLNGRVYETAAGRARIDGWLGERRRDLASRAPNAAHRMIAEYCASHPDTIVLTQNIDDLLERAGVPAANLVHLHGTLTHLRCRGGGHLVFTGYDADPAACCPQCGAQLRADVVLFEEPAPLYRTMWQTFDSLTGDDALVVIGTDGYVLPIGDVAHMVPALTVLNNLHASELIDEQVFDYVFREPATSAAPRIRALLERARAQRSSHETAQQD